MSFKASSVLPGPFVAAKLSKAISDREGGLFCDTGNETLGEYLDR